MIETSAIAGHDEAWLSLPWLANGRISQAERDKVEPHVRTCSACREEVAFQRLLCNSLMEPDRVTYAPGPSFRKLMDRIDGTAPKAPRAREGNKTPASPSSFQRNLNVSVWRPPGLAWAASFVLVIGLAGALTTVYRSSQPLYATHTDAVRGTPDVLHIAFDRSVTMGEAEEVLRSTGARIVEGPDSTGVFGVRPVATNAGDATQAHEGQRLPLLSARLRADPRVRWVEPVAAGESPGDAQTPPPRGQ